MGTPVLNTGRSTYRDNLVALQGAQKPPRGTAAYSRHVNRPLGRRVAAVLHLWGVTPNQATAISATLSAAALILVATVQPTPVLGLVVAVLLASGYVMDSVDGQLARLRGGGSLSGEMLDHTVDCVKTICLHLAVLITLFRFTSLDTLWLLVPVGFQVVDVMIYFGVVTMPLLRKLHGAAAPNDPQVRPAQERRPLLLTLRPSTLYVGGSCSLPTTGHSAGCSSSWFGLCSS